MIKLFPGHLIEAEKAMFSVSSAEANGRINGASTKAVSKPAASNSALIRSKPKMLVAPAIKTAGFCVTCIDQALISASTCS